MAKHKVRSEEDEIIVEPRNKARFNLAEKIELEV